MSQAITMPALSDTMSNGRLVKWVKKSGDKINKGDVIAEVETDKAVMEVEAFQDGYLSGPLAAEGTEAPVGQTIGYIADNLAEISSAAAAAIRSAGPECRQWKCRRDARGRAIGRLSGFGRFDGGAATLAAAWSTSVDPADERRTRRR